MGWLRRLSLRARLLLVSVVVLFVGLAGGGVVLVAAMNFALLRTAKLQKKPASHFQASFCF